MSPAHSPQSAATPPDHATAEPQPTGPASQDQTQRNPVVRAVESVITERTRVPLGVAWIVAGTLAVGGWWLQARLHRLDESIQSSQSQTEQRIDRLAAQIEAIRLELRYAGGDRWSRSQARQYHTELKAWLRRALPEADMSEYPHFPE